MLSQESELTAIKRKIRGLSEKTIENGATEGEAMVAMKKVGELLTQYNLSMSEVTLRVEPCVTKTYNTGNKKRNVIWNCFSGLQKLCGIKMWYNHGRTNGLSWSYFGLESDVEMAIYLSDMLTKTERTEALNFKDSLIYQTFDGHRAIPVNNFKLEFGSRLNHRLFLLAREREAAERTSAEFHAKAMRERMVTATDEARVAAAQATTGTALICVAKEKMIADEFARRGPKLSARATRSTGRFHIGSRMAGRDAANRVNLGRPLDGGSKPSGYLK